MAGKFELKLRLGLSAPAPSFEVAAIKPSHPGTPGPSFRFHGDGITIHSATLKAIMGFAFNVRDFQISGGPSWINSDRYDIEAKEPKAVQDGMLKLDFDQRTKMMGQLLQSLLADRFQLKVTHDTKELPVYALVVAKNGPKFSGGQAQRHLRQRIQKTRRSTRRGPVFAHGSGRD